jgi:hypothetical protein
MGKVTNIRFAGELSPERAALREAIVAAAEAERKYEQAVAAVETAQGLVEESEGKAGAATLAIEKARAEHADSLASSISAGDKPPINKRMREARIAEQDAGDDLAGAKAALAQLEARVPDAEYVAQEARSHVETLAKQVMRSETTHLLAQGQDLLERLVAVRSVLRWLVGVEIIDDEPRDPTRLRANLPMLRLYSPTVRFLGQAQTNDTDHSHPAARAFAGALEALRHNADARIPDFDAPSEA